MPRRKSSDSGLTKTRARTGCLTCRARKIKCDEGKPKCRNCARRGLVCNNGFQLKWETDYVRHGLAFGRQGIWNKRGEITQDLTGEPPLDQIVWHPVPTIGPFYFLNTVVQDFPEEGSIEENVTDIADDAVIISLPSSPTKFSVGQTPSMFPNLSGTAHTALLDYYLQRLTPLTTPAKVVLSPFASHIIPLLAVGGSANVLDSVLALAACHRSRTDPSWSQMAIQLKGNVLNSLRRAMAMATVAELLRDSRILVMMMFMCLYEINGGCDRRWVVHLRGSYEIIRRRRQLTLSSPRQLGYDPLASFTERFFAFQDVMGRTACGDVPLFGSDYWEDLEPQIEVDAWMGCSPRLAKIMCRITELCRIKSSQDGRSAWMQQAAALESDLETLRYVDQTILDDDQLTKSAELKRLAAELYLHCALYNASPTTPFVVERVRLILHQVSDFLQMGVVAGLSFAVFVSAVELDPLHDEIFLDQETGDSVYGRPLILAALDAMSCSSLSNVLRTRAVIQKVWRMRDLHLEESDEWQKNRSLRDHTDGSLPNDWEYFVVPVSANVSLA